MSDRYISLKGRKALVFVHPDGVSLRIQGVGETTYGQNYIDADLAHADLEVTIEDDDAFLYLDAKGGHSVVDYSVETITGGKAPAAKEEAGGSLKSLLETLQLDPSLDTWNNRVKAYGKPKRKHLYHCIIEHYHSKKRAEQVLKCVSEDDVMWRLPDDDAEFNEMSWDVIYWKVVEPLDKS